MGAEAIQDLLKQVDLKTKLLTQRRIEELQLVKKTCERLFVVWMSWMPFTNLVTSLNG